MIIAGKLNEIRAIVSMGTVKLNEIVGWSKIHTLDRGVRGCASGVGMDLVDLTMTTVVAITHNTNVAGTYGMLCGRRWTRAKKKKNRATAIVLAYGLCDSKKKTGDIEKAPKTENVPRKWWKPRRWRSKKKRLARKHSLRRFGVCGVKCCFVHTFQMAQIAELWREVLCDRWCLVAHATEREARTDATLM